MKNQENNNTGKPLLINNANGTLSRVLLIVAIIVYSISLVLLANLALAAGSVATKGALIKVNNQLDGDAFGKLQPDVKSHSGNILSINVDEATFLKLKSISGVCDARLDQPLNNANSSISFQQAINKYAGTDMIVGVLDNSGKISQSNLTMLKKKELLSNVGFISYKSNDHSSTVIITNLVGGESNLIQSLLYMHEYAKTVSKPLVIELILSGKELGNPLFVQACQKFVEAGVQFINGGQPLVFPKNNNVPQFAFAMFNPSTNQFTDKTDFWALSEIKGQQLMLLGSDKKMCSMKLENETGFDKVYLSNNSNDIIIVTALSSNGDVNYFHVSNKETALIPRELQNGAPFMADGLNGIYPFSTKNALFSEPVTRGQFVSLKEENTAIPLHASSGMNVMVGSPSERTLSMSLTELDQDLEIEIKHEDGTTVYRKTTDCDTRSIHAKINLAEDSEGLYFLDLTSPKYHQSIALMVN